MFSVHLFKRQANRRGVILQSMFCFYALALMIPAAADIFSGSGSCWWWWTGNLVIFFMSILSMVTPVISLLKPGFSYKGHPGMRHSTMAVAGCVIIIVSGCFVGTNMTKAATFLSGKQMILYGLVVPLHGLHCLVVYAALFKGPTSKFGKLYQPYLPIIE